MKGYKIVECYVVEAFCCNDCSKHLRIYVAESMEKAISFLRQKVSRSISKNDITYNGFLSGDYNNSFDKSKFFINLDIREIYIKKKTMLKKQNQYAELIFCKHNEIIEIYYE